MENLRIEVKTLIRLLEEMIRDATDESTDFFTRTESMSNILSLKRLELFLKEWLADSKKKEKELESEYRDILSCVMK